MSPNYGSNEKPAAHVVPDWLLGGNRKRRVLAALAERDRDWTVDELADEVACGITTVYEIVRALRPLGVLDDADGRLRLDLDEQLGQAIATLVKALEPHIEEAVDRPPRARDTS
jgi:hypothetical protein